MKHIYRFYLLSLTLVFMMGCDPEEPEPERLIINGLEYGKDFTDQIVYDTEFRVYSATNLSNDNITVKNFTLPEKTLFWSYWFVVKQGDQDPFAYAVRELSGEAAKYTTDPLTALGLGLISAIPVLQDNTETLDFYLTDYDNSVLAVNGESFEIYEFGQEENVVSVSKTVSDVPTNTIYTVSYNDNITLGLDAYLRVVAFVEL